MGKRERVTTENLSQVGSSLEDLSAKDTQNQIQSRTFLHFNQLKPSNELDEKKYRKIALDTCELSTAIDCE